MGAWMDKAIKDISKKAAEQMTEQLKELTESEPQPEIKFEKGKDRQNEMEIDRANGIIKGLRNRLADRSNSNGRMSEKHNQQAKKIAEYQSMVKDYESVKMELETKLAEYEHVLKIKNEEKDRMAESLDGFEAENKRLVDELTLANGYQLEQQDAVVKLHEQINNERDYRGRVDKEKTRILEDLQRANRVIDFMTKAHGL